MTYSTAQQLADISARTARVENDKLYVWDMSRRGRTRGLAEPEGGQVRALKNPDPVPGEVYLVWSEGGDDNSPTFIATYVGQFDGTRLFATFAYAIRPPTEDGGVDIRTTTSQHTFEDRVWVKARFDTVPLTEDQLEGTVDRAQELLRELKAEEAWFNEFDEALNSMADGHGWCGTYDDIVRAVGLSGREKEYWVEVEANCTVTDTNPSSRLDDLLGEHYGNSIVTSSVTFTAKVTVRVGGITASDHEDAHARVQRDDVMTELNSMLSGDVELDDWEIKDSGEEDD